MMFLLMVAAMVILAILAFPIAVGRIVWEISKAEYLLLNAWVDRKFNYPRKT